MEDHYTEAILEGASSTPLDCDIDTVSTLDLFSQSNRRCRPKYIPYQEFTRLYGDESDTSPGVPQYWTLYANEIIWSNYLSEPLRLELRYYRAPLQFTRDEDQPDIPFRYREILIRGGLAGIEEYRENFDIAAIHTRKIEELTEDMLLHYTTRQITRTHKAKFGGRRYGVKE
ncbi:hypothetical protein GS464_20235 [Rhodococcus hoagii]|nr:hypothetical protein [Prescottella equi]MBM4644766.1 hypothetical protein [Prescottella equi]MBM4644791.1 hypothetical protein [Prescottella equi]